MTRFLSEERAPLELTKPSKQQKLVICPHCLTGRYLSIQTLGFICSQCNEFVSESEFITDESKMNGPANSSKKILSPEYLEMRSKAEKQAYEYKDRVSKKKVNKK